MTTAQATACSDPAALPEEVRRFAAERLGGPRARSVLIPTLHLLQNTVGYLRDDHMAEVARMFGISPNEVRGVASFYHFFSFEPKGKHPIAVCTGTACHVRGAAAVLHQDQDDARGRGGWADRGRAVLHRLRPLHRDVRHGPGRHGGRPKVYGSVGHGRRREDARSARLRGDRKTTKPKGTAARAQPSGEAR
jgi:hypothetical protein